MQIIIPMSGFGERFRRAGYDTPKPLIYVEGKPVIHHVIDLFDPDDDFFFICNNDHLANTEMRRLISDYCPKGEIVGIEPHKKGPVYAVSQILNKISLSSPTIINYCDFTCYWNYRLFKDRVEKSYVDGCIPVYKGFHPHSLGSTNYAYIRERRGRVLGIQEKRPFTKNKMDEYASSGTYYFSSGKHVANYFRRLLDRDISVGGEYYCSLAYNLMIEDGLDVSYYEIDYFMQWGTPEDLEEYRRWSNIFKRLCKQQTIRPAISGTTLIPMAGVGKRFKDEGYVTLKPFISVSGKRMVEQAVDSLPETERLCLVTRGEESKDVARSLYPQAMVIKVDRETRGQADTCLKAYDLIDLDRPLVVSACDHAVLIDRDYTQELEAGSVDVLVLGARGYPNAMKNPEMYGWVSVKDGGIEEVLVKKLPESLEEDLVIVGTFIFRKARFFYDSVTALIERKGLVKEEYYIDSCINDAITLGLKCKAVEVDEFICWGTPNELKTFEYWQRCFSLWPGHPYQLKDDYMQIERSR